MPNCTGCILGAAVRAIRINDFKNEPRLDEVPLPVVGPGDVLIHVEAASLNPQDVPIATGFDGNRFDIRLPHTPRSLSSFNEISDAPRPGLKNLA